MKAVMETSDAVRPAARMTADEVVDGTDDDGAMFVQSKDTDIFTIHRFCVYD